MASDASNVVYAGCGGADAIRCPRTTTATAAPTSRSKDDSGRWRIDFAADGFGNVNVSLLGYGDARSPCRAC